MIIFSDKRQVHRIGTDPAARCYYFGLDLPPGIKERFSYRPLAGLTEIARELKEAVVQFIAAAFSAADHPAVITSSLVENAYGVENLFLELCYLRYAERLVAERSDRDPLLLVFATPEMRDAGFAALQGKTDEECVRMVGPLETLANYCRQCVPFVRSRYHGLKYFLSRVCAAGRYRPAPGAGPLTLVRTWLDQRNFSEGGFTEQYLGGLVRRARFRIVYCFHVLYTFSYAEALARLERLRVPFITDEQYLTWFDVAAALVVALRPPARYRGLVFQGLEITALCNRHLREDWVRNRYFDYWLQERALRRMAQSGLELAELFYPFENQPWEKVLNLAVARHYPEAKRYGYQHAIVSDYYLGHFDRYPERVKDRYPHTIFTAGRLFAAKLRRYYPDLVVEERAYRYGQLFHPVGVSFARYRERGRAVLVALPADYHLCVEVMAKVHAAFRDGGEPIWIKGHPATSLRPEALVPGGKFPPHFTVIERTRRIEELVAELAVVCYTDSTVSLEALAHGVPVVQIVPERGLNCDFLPAELKTAVMTPAELREAVRACRERYASERNYGEFLAAGRRFLGECFHDPGAPAVADTVPAGGSPGRS